MNDPGLAPRPSLQPSERPKGPVTSLGAIAASHNPTIPATPKARQKRANKLLSALRWAGLGLLLSLGPIAALAAREEAKPRLKHHILHGAAEIKRAPNGDQVRWRRSHTTVVLDASLDRYGPRAREAVQSAFGTWLELDTHAPSLTFDTARHTKFSLEPDGRNSVLVAPINLPGHEDDLAITLAFWDERTGSIAEVDIVINAKVPFSVLDDGERQRDEHDRDGVEQADVHQHRECISGAYDLQNVLTHEVGHFMGLGEDMKVDEASMYYRSHRCETQKRTLARPDESSVITLYTVPADEDPTEARAASCAFEPAPGADSGAASAFAAFAGLALVALRRRR